jgi:glycerophosphoryl diester phosphodiesterase
MSRRLACAIAVTVACVSVTMAAAGEQPLVAAHRGGAALWPENSLLAFRNAMALGVDALEFDLHLTRDGEVVVIHDATLDRTTTASGRVRDRTLAEVRNAHIKTREGTPTGERVPTFAEVLDLASASAVQLLPEIKVGADGQPYPDIEEKVVALIRARGLLSRVTIQAFHSQTIGRLRGVQPDVRTMLLGSRRQLESKGGGAEAVRWAREAGATDVGLDFHIVDAAVVSASRAARIRLSVWTVNDEADIRRMVDLGVDVIMSDRPDLVRRLIGRP